MKNFMKMKVLLPPQPWAAILVANWDPQNEFSEDEGLVLMLPQPWAAILVANWDPQNEGFSEGEDVDAATTLGSNPSCFLIDARNRFAEGFSEGEGAVAATTLTAIPAVMWLRPTKWFPKNCSEDGGSIVMPC